MSVHTLSLKIYFMKAQLLKEFLFKALSEREK